MPDLCSVGSEAVVAVTAFLDCGGEMGALMRAYDWAGTPVGPPASWPQSLKTSVRLALTSRHPMFIWWGEALTCFYNDAYSTAIGPDRHPSALGRPGREVWAEIWDFIGPDIEHVMAGRGATWHERQLVPITRGSVREDVWWTYGYSPIDDEVMAAGVGGVLVICRDVTAEVLAERAKTDEAERLRLLFQQAPGFMAMLRGPTHVFELTNAAYDLLVGRDVLGRPVREALPDIEGQGLFEKLDEVYATGMAYVARRRPVALAPGASTATSHRFLDFIYQPVRDASGALTGIFVQGSDVTETALAENEVRASEARQALLLHLVQRQRETDDPDTIVQAACEAIGRHLDVDRVGYFTVLDDDTLGSIVTWTNGELGRPGDASLAKEIRKACVDQARRGAGAVLVIADVAQDPLTASLALADTGVRSLIAVTIARNGRCRAGMHVSHATVRVWTAAEIALVREVADQAWDAIERVRVASELAESEQRLRTLLEGIPQLVWRADRPGEWSWVSPQWLAYTGLSLEASIGKGWLAALHPEDRPVAMAAWQEAEANGLLEVDFRIRHANSGHYHWYQTRGTPVRGKDGRIVEWTGTCTDVDDRMQARAALARNGEELERQVAERTAELRQSEKLKAIGQLTGGIAHDFNNMLQAITGSLGLMRSRLQQGRASDVVSYIERAEKGALRAAALTHRLLAFARQQALAPELVSLDKIAHGMEDMIRRTVGPAVQVELKLADGEWLVMCDPNQMESALLNLCVNARDAMPDGGWLTISTSELMLSEAEVRGHEEAQPGRYSAVAVTDTGTGMGPDVLGHVFEPFFTTKPLGQGTGLGLSQIYGFVRQSGGVVQIETALGEGTTIRLCLPFHEHNPAATAHPQETSQTVLLVEDEQDVREVVADLLRDLGYRVLEADSGGAALRILQTGVQLDLLVSDVGLPGGMNGRQVADAMRLRHPGLPTILMTGYAAPELLAGMEVIRKPFDPMQLAELVRSRLEPVDVAS